MNPTKLKYLCLLCFFLFSGLARGESGRFNLHLEVGPSFALTGWQSYEFDPGAFAGTRLEFGLRPWIGLDVGISYVQFFSGSHPEGYQPISKPGAFTAGFGARFRPFNDEQGYLLPWKSDPAHTGNLWGNLWIDVHANYVLTGDFHRFGGDVGVGFEFSVVNGLQMGPFVRCAFVYQPESTNERNSEDVWLLTAGLTFSLAIPPEGKKLTDEDSDGIFGPADRCPLVAEDMDDFQDDDGCPDEDDDNDRIPDESDVKCRFKPEDWDGFEDEDGCPDIDNDKDGLLDSEDKCPNKPEDFDKFEDEDGCPEEDNDRDGVLDTDDKCPDELEIVNNIDDHDGCPESDTDGDGITDQKDSCPEKPETINGLNDSDGCPDSNYVEVQGNSILFEQIVIFDINQSRIKTRSKEMLRQLAALIRQHPEYTLISIDGYADPMGTPEFNQELSSARANRVRDFLIAQGISPQRLVAEGRGSSSPVQGKDVTKSRRVEASIKSIHHKPVEVSAEQLQRLKQ